VLSYQDIHYGGIGVDANDYITTSFSYIWQNIR